MDIDIEAIVTHLDELKDTKARLNFELSAVEKEIDKEELKLAALLENNNVNQMTYGIYSFRWKYTKRTAFSQSLFKKDEPELFNKYNITTKSKKIEFKINK